jgi:hypothetical protein
MSLTPSLTKVCGLIKTAGQAGDIGAAGAGAVAIAGVTLTLPWSAVCAAGIIALAGAAVLVERRDAEQAEARAAEHDQQADDVRQWVEAFARDKACRAGGLSAAIEAHLKDNPDALDGLPANITRDHLTTFLSIIKATGDKQSRLLKEHDGFVRAVSAEVIERLDAVNKSLRAIEGLVELTHGEVRSMAAATVVTGKTAAETRSLVTELLFKHDRSRSPALHIPLDTTGLASQRFIFRSRTLACVGRRDEFIELDRWLHKDTRPFSWDLWTAMAGMGKSRLALELCLKLPASWDAGFMDWGAGRDIDWTTWTPGRSMLIVCDYVAREVDQIKTMLDRLASYTGSNRVRVLLLERPIARFERPSADDDPAGGLSLAMTQAAAEGWWTKLGVGTDGAFQTTHARSMADGKPDRMLEGISEDALREMIRADAQASAAEGGSIIDEAEVERRAALITEVSPNRRPLYIAMAAEAIREKAEDTEAEGVMIDAKTLVEHIRDKENKEHWTPALKDIPADRGTADGYRRLLCLATLCGGLTGDALRGALNDERFKDEDGNRLVPSASLYGDGAIYARLIPDADASNAPKLEPDLLGECFVLSFLLGQNDLAQRMIAVGWDHARAGVADFLRRAAGNFPEHPGIETLLGCLPASVEDGVRASVLSDRAGPAFKQQDSARVGRLGTTALAREGIGPHEQAAAYFLALSGTPSDEALPGLLAGAIKLANSTTEPEIRARLAAALSNAVVQVGWNADWADALLVQLHTLAKAHPDEFAIREDLARALNNAVIHAGPELNLADERLGELRTLAEDHNDESALREWLAEAVFNAFLDAGSNTVRTDALLTELHTLAVKHSDEPALRRWLAEALFDSVNLAGSDRNRADVLLGQLRTLAEDHPDEPALREWLAKALFNALSHAGSNTDRADELLEELSTLAKDHPDEPALQERLAKALVNGVAHADSDTDRDDALLNQLHTLAEKHDDEPALKFSLAEGLFNVIVLRGPASTETARHVVALEQLLASSPITGAAFVASLISDANRCEPTEMNQAYMAFFLDMFSRAIQRTESGPSKDRFDDAWTMLFFVYRSKWPDAATD